MDQAGIIAKRAVNVALHADTTAQSDYAGEVYSELKAYFELEEAGHRENPEVKF